MPSLLVLFIMMIATAGWAQSRVYECPPPSRYLRIDNSETQRMSLTYNESTRAVTARIQLKDGTETDGISCPPYKLDPGVYSCPVGSDVSFLMKLDHEARTCRIVVLVTGPHHKAPVAP